MLARWFSGLAALGMLVLVTPVRAADDKKPEPVLVVQVRSLNAVIDTAKYLASLAGQEERAKQAERMLRNRIGKKGLEGIDAKRPFILYAFEVNPTRPPVLMIPVADKKPLLDLLKGLDLEATEKDGLYTVSPDFLPVEAYFRFAHGYAYVTAADAGSVSADKLLDPADLPPANARVLASARLNIDRLPGAIKQLAINGLEKQLQKIQKQKPRRESKVETQFRLESLKEIAATMARVIKEGGQLGLQVEVNRQTHDLAFQFSLTGKSGSQLVQDIARLGETTTLFGALAGPNAAADGFVHFTLPEGIRKALGPVIDDGMKRFREEEQDETKRELGEKLFKAISPSLKAGEVDWFATLRGPNDAKHYTGLMAIKVRDAAQLEKTIRDIIDRVAPQSEKDKIKYDADKVGDVAIHRVAIKDNLDENTKKTFGEADLYVAFRKDAVFAALGENGLEIIKEAIAARPKKAPVVQMEASLGRLLSVMALQPRGAEIAPAAAKVFADDKNGGKIRFTLQGGKALTARLRVTALAIKFFMITREQQAAEPAER